MPNLNVIGTRNNAFVSAARVILGLFVLLTGVLTFFVPDLRAAFAEQLGAAGIPLQRMTFFVIPALEATAGVMLMGRVLTRIASLATIIVMGLVTYLHLMVSDPVVFPLQFGLPLIPIVSLVLAGFLYFVEEDFEDGVP